MIRGSIDRRDFLWAAAAALIGLLATGVFFGRWSVAQWPLLSRAELESRAHAASANFGLDTQGWRAYVTEETARGLDGYRRAHPNDTYAASISPLTVRITFVQKSTGRVAQVGLDSGGQLLSWDPPKEFQPTTTVSDEAAASEAKQLLAGGDAASYKPSIKAATGKLGDRYVWDRSAPAGSAVTAQIAAEVKNGAVRQAQRTFALTPAVAALYGRESSVRDGLRGIFAFGSFVATVIAIAFFVLWLVRKAISAWFALRLALVNFAVLAALETLGATGEGSFANYYAQHRFDLVQFGMLVIPALTIALICAGRGISAPGLPKWATLEQLAWRAPLSQRAGASMLIGILVAPLLVAAPFLIAAFAPRGVAIESHSTEAIYSRVPILEAAGLPFEPVLIGFLGFVLPLAARAIRTHWLRVALIAAAGTIFFTVYSVGFREAWPAALVCGALTFAIFRVLYIKYDLLAALTAQFASGLIWFAFLFSRAASPDLHWQAAGFFAALAVLLLAAAALLWKGRKESAGDPAATTPAITVFDVEADKLRAEFSVARRAQQDMLPQEAPLVPGCSIAASCTPSLEVGGDLYDFLKLPDGRIGIGVADVSGKGVPAALYMTLTKGLLAAITRDSTDLAAVMTDVNRHLHAVARKKVFVTMALGFLDPVRKVMHYARAGHNPVVWRRAAAGSTTLLSPPGMGLGITGGRIFSTHLQVQELALANGDTLVFYSDGVTEAMNADLEQFGEGRLIAAVDRTASFDARRAHDSILGEVRDFLGGVHPQDDMTLVVLRVGDADHNNEYL